MQFFMKLRDVKPGEISTKQEVPITPEMRSLIMAMFNIDNLPEDVWSVEFNISVQVNRIVNPQEC